ncbi:MAG: YdcH family protein [Gammaproteobacteria bacterium]
MSEEKEESNSQLRQRVEALRIEHRDLDDIIQHLSNDADVDQLQIRRMKKRKLLIKDMIARIESRLIPDLNA